MSDINEIVKMLDHNYLDTRDAFKGLLERHLHQRPAKGTIAISEIAAHIAYCEARGIFYKLFDLPIKEWPVKGPFIHYANLYPPMIYKNPIRPALLEMGVADVREELFRIHDAAFSKLKEFRGDPDSQMAGAWGIGGTLRNHLSYLAFHVAYHTGQIYLTRHMLGEKTPSQ